MNKAYRISVDEIKNQTASLSGKGSLSFDANMGLLDIPIDFLEQGEALRINSKNFTVLASNICFESSSKVSVGSATDFVWVSEQTKENYTSAETTVNLAAGESTDLSSAVFSTEAAESRNDCGTSSLLVTASNYPNPFSETTKLSYTIQYDTTVKLLSLIHI